MAEHNSSKYYVPESSPWPLFGSIGLFLIAIGAANFIQQSTEFGQNTLRNTGYMGGWILISGVLVIIATMFMWWRDVIGEAQLKYLKAGMECEGLVYNDKVIMVELPFFVELKIVQTDPGVRGDTATGGTKPAKLETGATVQVPLFIEEGEVIRVDRREDKYLTRV